MAHKFEIINQSLVISDTENIMNTKYFTKADVYFMADYLPKGKIYIYDLTQENMNSSSLYFGDLSNAIDGANVPFTESTFLNFGLQNLGFKTASGGSGAITLTPIGSVVINESINQGNILNEDYAIAGLLSDKPVTINWNGLVFPTTAFVSYRALRDGFINITIENKGDTTLNINQTIIINN